MTHPAPDTWAILSGIFGGLALFLYGLDRLTSSLNRMAGGQLRALLEAATSSRLRALLTGAGVTAVVQSSSVTTVLCVGFISAGLMNLGQAVGVIVGANVGTTVTAQFIAFDVTRAALPLVAAGTAVWLLAGRQAVRHVGSVILGLGLIFYGMALMSEAAAPLRGYPPFLELMQSLQQAWRGILVGALVTALIQSSSAFTGIVIVLAGQDLITLQAGIALVLGANVGTCLTALMAAASRGRLALQAGAVHVLFNLIGAFIWWLLLEQLTSLTLALSPAGDLPRQIANAHTLFNVSCALLLLPLMHALVPLVERLLPAPSLPPTAEVRFLDEIFLSVPSLALDRVKREVLHMGEHALALVRSLPREDEVDVRVLPLEKLHDAVVDYMRRLTTREMTPREAREFENYLVIANALEAVGTVIRDLVRFEFRLQEQDAGFLADLESLHLQVADCLEQALRSIEEPGLAAGVIEEKPRVRHIRDESLRLAINHLESGRPGVVNRFRERANQVDHLRRLFYLASRIARAVLAREDLPAPPTR